MGFSNTTNKTTNKKHQSEIQRTSKAFQAMAPVTCSRSCKTKRLVRRSTPPTCSQWSRVMQVCSFWSSKTAALKQIDRLKDTMLEHGSFLILTGTRKTDVFSWSIMIFRSKIHGCLGRFCCVWTNFPIELSIVGLLTSQTAKESNLPVVDQGGAVPEV